MAFNFHKDRRKYFEQQYQNTKNYIIPFIEDKSILTDKMKVLEIGCGEGGILKVFYELGCHITGIDLSENKIKNANKYFSELNSSSNFQFILCDIFKVDPKNMKNFDLIILKDTIEHIHNQEKLISILKKISNQNGYIFIAFPPWQMPWGGHQQMCDNKIVSLMPYIHLLPKFLYKGILKLFAENKKKIEHLLEIKETHITIERFEKIVKNLNIKIIKRKFYLINPNYEIKFGFKPREQFKIISVIPYLRGLFTTTCFYLLKIE